MMTVNLRTISITVAIALAVLNLVGAFAANPQDLGLTAVQFRWLFIVSGGLSAAASFLPPVVKYGAEARETKRRKAAASKIIVPPDEHNV